MVEVAITDAGFRKQIGTLAADEGIFPTTRQGLSQLKPVRSGGTVTYGAQTHPADGNAGIIVTSLEKAREVALDRAIEVEILGFGMARAEKGHMPMAPAPASRKALQAAGLDIGAVDAVKSHNPFAVNYIAFSRDTGFPLEKMNNFGCSLIWGHPQGPTGMRGIVELIEELALRGGGIGLFNGCAAGDSGMAVVLRVTDSKSA
jgi:acetyl-CoA acetyltransferase